MEIQIVGDIHGDYDRLMELLHPEKFTIFLGDYVHRGPKSWDVIKFVTRHKNCIKLAGNHCMALILKVLNEKNPHPYLSDDINGLFYSHARDDSVYLNLLDNMDIFYEWYNSLYLYEDNKYRFQHFDTLKIEKFPYRKISDYNVEELFIMLCELCDSRLFDRCSQEDFDSYLFRNNIEGIFHGHTPHNGNSIKTTYGKAYNCDGNLSCYYSSKPDRGFVHNTTI